MPISVSPDVTIDAFNEARFIGFKRLPSGSLVGLFKVSGLPQQVTKLYREPIDLVMLNELRGAAGLAPLRANHRIVLPTVGDRNMLGYDKRMLAYLILKDSGYYDITDVRPLEPENECIEFDPETGEVYEYKSMAA